MKKANKKLIIYLIAIFMFTLIFSLLIPLGGDDWGNYLKKGLSVGEVFEVAKSFYMTWEGRFFSRIFLSLIVPHPILWALINATMMTCLFYLMFKILKIEDKYLPLLLMCLLFVDYQTYAQVYVWHTGNITYFIPMGYAFLLIFCRKNLLFNEVVIVKWYDYLLIPLTFIFSMFVENVTIGIIFICLLNLIFYYLKYKKLDIAMLLNLAVSIIGFCLMYFSPGTQARAAVEGDFNQLSIFGKLLYNIPNLVNFTFIKNSFLTLFFIVVMSVIVKRYVQKNICKYLLWFFIVVPASVSLVVNMIAPFITLPSVVLKVINPENIFVNIYWILFIIVFLFLIIYYLKADKTIWYFIVLAMVSNGAMMMSPVWGGRTACFTTFMLYMVLILILKKLDIKIFNNKIAICMAIICGLFMIIFTGYSIKVYDLNVDRNKYIDYQLKQNKKEFEIIILPGYYTWNLNTWGSDGDFAYNFKKANGIDKDAPLIYVYKENVKVNLDKLK